MKDLKCDDARLLGITWATDGRDLTVDLELAGADGGHVRLLCEWAHGLHIALDTAERTSGSPLSWDVTFEQATTGEWTVRMDFASTGEVFFKCSTISVHWPDDTA